MNYDLIITTNYIKKELLLEYSKNNIITSTKIVTKKELEKMLLGEATYEGVFAITKEYKCSANIAKLYMDNVIYKASSLKEYYNFLSNNNYITFPDVKYSFDNILVINETIDNYILEYFKNSNITYNTKESIYNHEVNYFSSASEEVVFVAEKIIESNIDYTNIKLVNVTGEYIKIVKKIFSFYNIPVNIENNISIIKTNSFDKFISILKDTKNIEHSLELIENSTLYDIVLRYFNKYNFPNIDDNVINIIIDYFKDIYLPETKIINAVECINYKDIYNKDNYYYMFSFDDKALGIYKDEDYLSDLEKTKLGLLTSRNKNILNTKIFKNIYNTTKNLVISFSTQSKFNSYNPNNFIKDNKLIINKNNEITYKYSNKYNKIKLGEFLDLYIKFNEITDSLIKLHSTYEVPFSSYDNSYKIVEKEVLSYPVNLSYSSVKNYYECGFKYYVDRVLKLGKHENNLGTIIGNIFHAVLSRMYNEDFNVDTEYEKELSELELLPKEVFFINLVKPELIKVIDFLRSFDKQTSLKSNLCEQEFIVENIIENKVNFKGIIDNIKYNKDNNLMILIDYKSGFYESKLDNLNYGMNLQLPSYLYLMDKCKNDYKVVGMYISKVLEPTKLNEIESTKKYKFMGYSTTNLDNLALIDSTYNDSLYIKNLKLGKSGLSSYAKVLDEINFIKIKDIAEDKIKEAAKKIVNNEFNINPKVIDNNDISCKYCKYKDLCYKSYENIVELESTSLKDLIKEEECQDLLKNNN